MKRKRSNKMYIENKRSIVDHIVRFGSIGAEMPWSSNGGSCDCQVKEKPEPHGYNAQKPKGCLSNCKKQKQK